MVQRTNIVNCCVGTIFSNFGGAHGVAVPKSKKAFQEILYKHSPFTVNLAILNDGQRTVREWLKEEGWTEQRVSYLYVMTIDGTTFIKSKNIYLSEKRAAEEEARRVQASKDAQKEKDKQRGMAFISPSVAIPKYRNRVIYDDILDIFRQYNSHENRYDAMDRLYGVKLNRDHDAYTAFHSIKTQVANRVRNG